VAYVSETLPNLEELERFDTRSLDEFEARALESLRGENDLVVEETAGRIHMLGSLRAGRDCRLCHTVPRGFLLGAFSYVLVPDPSAAQSDIQQELPERPTPPFIPKARRPRRRVRIDRRHPVLWFVMRFRPHRRIKYRSTSAASGAARRTKESASDDASRPRSGLKP
jgi:hypothetical protein